LKYFLLLEDEESFQGWKQAFKVGRSFEDSRKLLRLKKAFDVVTSFESSRELSKLFRGCLVFEAQIDQSSKQ
jgi:hypothetical protein